jgi:hypothetical protein
MMVLLGRRICDGFFPLRTYERAYLCSPSQDYRRFRREDFKQQRVRSVRTFSGVVENMLCVALPSTRNNGGFFAHLLEAPTVWSFDSMNYLAVTCILITRRCRTCFTIFSTCLLTSSYAMENCERISFHESFCVFDLCYSPQVTLLIITELGYLSCLLIRNIDISRLGSDFLSVI